MDFGLLTEMYWYQFFSMLLTLDVTMKPSVMGEKGQENCEDLPLKLRIRQ